MRLIPLYIIVLSVSVPGVAKPRRGKARRPAALNAQVLPDYRARALLRKQAPFVVETAADGLAIRINKDGTFTRAVGSTAYLPDGKWRVINNHVKLRWNSGEERDFPVAFSGVKPVISGQRANRDGNFAVGPAR